jgi:hypothetical protein
MNNFFIYSYLTEEKDKFSDGKVKKSITVLFCPNQEIHETILQDEIRRFFEMNFQPDELHIIGGDYLKPQLLKVFVDDFSETFKSIPRLHNDFFTKNLFIETFDENGTLSSANCYMKSLDFFGKLVNEGLIKIFKDNNGLIESPESHHYVFPSQKHCNKFLRTGNVLLHTSEIFFIAFTLLRNYNHNEIKFIYCDTSSINSLAFALIELKKRFVPDLKYPPIESFKSYEAFSNAEFKFKRDSLLIVSSSTSGSIIERLINSKSNVQRNNIVIIYFLGTGENLKSHRSNINCNLTFDNENNVNGIDYYKTFKNAAECEFCNKGSIPIEVEGDAFLNNIPKVNKLVFTIFDPPSTLSNFSKTFLSYKHHELNILKCHYEENSGSPTRRYEVYFDMQSIIENISLPHLKSFKEKLDKYINQSIPSNTLYLIHLPDNGSKKLGQYILDKISSKYNEADKPALVDIDAISEEMLKDKEGAIVGIAASVVRGRNLLFLSRTLRDFEKLSIVYFVGLARPSSEEYFDFLKKNLTQGDYGLASNVFVHVEKMLCSNIIKNNPWAIEIEYLKEFLEFMEKSNKYDDSIVKYFRNRLGILENSTVSRGLANDIFLPQFPGNNELALHKTFAFFNFNGYHEHVSQGDVYFTISTLINKLRYSKNNGKCLIQTAYIRNVIDPHNFHRFNDGIIQAAILRAANEKELSYNIDESLSYEILTILTNLISHHGDVYGESLMEFILAIGLRKLKMTDDHINDFFEQIKKYVTDIFLKAFSEFAEIKYKNIALK